MHNFDSLCFIKEITSIVKAAAFLIYLQVFNIKFQEGQKSNVKENFQGNVKQKGEGGMCFFFFFQVFTSFALQCCFAFQLEFLSFL